MDLRNVVSGINTKTDLEAKIKEYEESAKKLEQISMSQKEKDAIEQEIADLKAKITALEAERTQIEADRASGADVLETNRKEERNSKALYEANEAIMAAKMKLADGSKDKDSEDLDKQIAEHQRNIEKYEEMLNTPDNTLDYVESARQQGTIRDLIKEEKDKIAAVEKKKDELAKKMNSDEVKKKQSELFDEKSAFYTQLQMKLEAEIKDLELEHSTVLQKGVTDPKYIYEGVTSEMKKELDAKIAAGTDMRYLEANAMQNKLNELKEMVAICEAQKQALKSELDKKSEPIQKILDETYGKPEVKKGEGDKGKAGEGDKGKAGEGDKGKAGEGDKGKAGEGDKGKAGEGDKGKTGEGDEDKGKGALLTGKDQWDTLSFFEKYSAKKKAYELNNGDKPGILRKIGMFILPMAYRKETINVIDSGEAKYVTGESLEDFTKRINDALGKEPETGSKEPEKDPFKLDEDVVEATIMQGAVSSLFKVMEENPGKYKMEDLLKGCSKSFKVDQEKLKTAVETEQKRRDEVAAKKEEKAKAPEKTDRT